MMPMNANDVPLYGEFTALKRNGLQTWIAIGGVSSALLRPITPLTS
jgi:chitinase